MAGAISQPRQSSQFLLLDEKSAVVPVRLAGEQSGGKRKVSYGDARSNSERAAPSAWVGKRLSAPQRTPEIDFAERYPRHSIIRRISRIGSFLPREVKIDGAKRNLQRDQH